MRGYNKIVTAVDFFYDFVILINRAGLSVDGVPIKIICSFFRNERESTKEPAFACSCWSIRWKYKIIWIYAQKNQCIFTPNFCRWSLLVLSLWANIQISDDYQSVRFLDLNELSGSTNFERYTLKVVHVKIKNEHTDNSQMVSSLCMIMVVHM